MVYPVRHEINVTKQKLCMLVRNNFINDTRVLNEAIALSEKYKVAIIAIKRSKELPGKEQLANGIQLIRVPLFLGGFNKLASGRILKLLFSPILILQRIVTNLRIVRLALREKAAYYHAHDLDMLLEGYIGSKFARGKLIYDSHELFSEKSTMHNRKIRKKLVLVYERFLIKRANAVITVTDSIASYLADLYKIKKPSVIRNVQNLVDERAGQDIRTALGIDKKKPILVYIGKICEGRGLEVLAESLKYIPDAYLVMIGSIAGKTSNRIKNISVKNNTCDRLIIRQPMHVSALKSYLRTADIGVIPTPGDCLSHYYGLGNKIFQCLEFCLPIVCRDHPEKAKIVIGENIGVTVSGIDARSLALAVEEALKNKAEYTNNLKLISGKFSWEKESETLLNIYKELSS